MSGRPGFVRARLLLALVVAAGALAAPGAVIASRTAPPSTARDLAGIYFSTTMARAEVLSYVGRVEHDYRIDEGRITAVRPNAIDVLERDGTRQTIGVGPQTQVVGLGRFAAAPLARGLRVVALRDGDGPAVQIRPASSARALGRTLFGLTFVRAEVLTYSGKTPHDVRIDEGRIVSVKPSAITLLERDGTRQTIAVNDSTAVSEGGQPVDQSLVARGLAAITIREGGGPAEQILLVPGVPAVKG